jgi:hypothetical protein
MEKTIEQLTDEIRESAQGFSNAVKELQTLMVQRGFTTWEAIEANRGGADVHP